MERRDLARFNDGLFDWFLKMGFNMTMEDPVYQFEKIEFCQTRPVFDGEKYIMCRNPRTALAKDTVMIAPGSTVQYYQSWMDAVGKGGLALTGGLPVYPAFYKMFCRSGKPMVRLHSQAFSWGVRHLIGNLNRSKLQCVSPMARASFYWAFGITPDAQICLENFYDGVTIDVQRFDKLSFVHDLPL